ncbi:MAG: hypothetical protein K6U80_19510 [Firmicutes bacterium]|nr:hypothetical protein [Bacillota bacterium]
MRARVKPTAKNLGGEVYEPGPSKGWAKDLGANRRWIEGVMDKGRTIVDIGSPPNYPPSDYYNLELRSIAARKYPTVKLNVESFWFKWLIEW